MNTSLSPLFDHLKIQNRYLKQLILVQTLIIILALLTQSKPPIIIRETENGAIITKNYVFENKVNAIDIDLFAKTFIKRLNFIDSFAIQENIPEALSMMSKKLHTHYVNNIIKKSKISTIINQHNKTTTKVKSVDYTSSGSIIHCTIIFERDVIGFETKKLTQLIIRAEALFEIVSRSKEFPYGLQVNDYKEIRLS
ncbi:hypothetical protein DID78_05800 [Candidatus Marinamargulisbacteria bacterium SCGC AG-343-D04]|nr:hypothetical protein DID78_05800 [Candidatus Marinamargulisbacteria bacterium SCGC AG-343-D04]